MILYLVRHGQDDPTVRGGWSHSPLTDEGVRQARSLAAEIARGGSAPPFSRILSSDLPRAMQTAGFIAEALRLPVEARSEFRETNNGELAGMKNDVALVRYPGLFWSALEWNERYPGGESPSAFYERISGAWAALTGELSETDENAILVTHGGVIHVIRHLILGTRWSNREKQPPVPHASFISLECASEKWHIL